MDRAERPAWARLWCTAMAVLTVEGFALRLLYALLAGTWPQMDGAERARALLLGLRYDLAIASLLSLVTLAALALWRLLRRTRGAGRGWLALPALALYLMQIGDLLYAQESGRHVSYELGEVLASGSNLAAMLPHYWPYLLAAVPVAVVAGRFPVPLRRAPERSRFRAFASRSAWLCGLLALSTLSARGGVQRLPLQPSDAYTLGSGPVSATALNGAFAVAWGAAHRDRLVAKPRLAPLDPARQQELLAALYRADPSVPPPGSPRPVNIVVIFLESWPAQIIRSYGYDRDVAPRFDALRAQGLTARAMIAGGHRTTEGLFAALCSFQNVGAHSVAVSQLMALPYHCLPQRLREAGWTTAFFQGMHRNAANVGNLVQKLGFEFNWGKDEIPGPPRYAPNAWGLHDPDLYAFVAQRRRELREPWFIGINTTTTHDETLPDNVPPAFGMGDEQARRLSVLHFADAALGDFVAAVAAAPARYPTVFVLVADHTAHVQGTAFHQYAIPFAIYAPGLIAPRNLDLAASQRDIAPTLLDLIGLPHADLAGDSLLHPRPEHFAEYQDAGRIGWFAGPRLVDFDAATGADLRCFDWTGEPGMQEPLACGDGDERARDRALAFTHYSMDLLFSGHTAAFGTGHWHLP